mmetsp:Transcript_26647/g.74559  ORF Transcript_26647/g.74559 Transcript_26647/m.74559 type:complete len:380 (-) Transcript_26647:133-1272(-)
MMFFFHCTSSMKCRSIMVVATVHANLMVSSLPPSAPSALNILTKMSSSLETSPRTLACLSASPLRRFNCATARSVTSRASGSEMELALVSRAGSRSGRNGAASNGLSTSLLMLLMMTADWRLVAMAFSRSPRSKSGTTMARAGDSTDWTKVTPAISCMISGTSLGLVMAVMIFLFMCSMSLFPTTPRAFFMAVLAAVLTCFLVSHMQAVTSGTMSGRASPSCLGAFSLNRATHWSASSRMGHFFSTGRAPKIAGNSAFIPNGVTLSQIANAVTWAASLTALDLWLACSKHAAKQSLVKTCVDAATSEVTSVSTSFRAAMASSSVLLPHRATKVPMLAANPDLSTPSALMVSTTLDVSSSVSAASLDSKDMLREVNGCAG